ncbi:MAG: methyltransferase domain-containing protein [Desulfobacterales bacterium]|nr:methyltransferase domain-containing protein [Desulfobacterales bacterium]
MSPVLTPGQIALREVFHKAWGPHLHIGVFKGPDEPIADAAARSSRLTAEKVKPRMGDEVLEVGCGFGCAAEMLTRTFQCRVVATDIEGWRIDEAKQRINKLKQRIGDLDGLVFERADHGDLPYRDERYDLVWATGTLSYAGDLHQSIREVARVLKPGGGLLIRDFHTAPSVDDPAIVETETHTHRLWPVDRWESALAEVGLSVDLLEDETDIARETYFRLKNAFHELIDAHGDAAMEGERIMTNRLRRIDAGLFGCFMIIARKGETDKSE